MKQGAPTLPPPSSRQNYDINPLTCSRSDHCQNSVIILFLLFNTTRRLRPYQVETTVLVRSLKLSKVVLGQYSDNDQLVNTRCCKLHDRLRKVAINTIPLFILTSLYGGDSGLIGRKTYQELGKNTIHYSSFIIGEIKKLNWPC